MVEKINKQNRNFPDSLDSIKQDKSLDGFHKFYIKLLFITFSPLNNKMSLITDSSYPFAIYVSEKGGHLVALQEKEKMLVTSIFSFSKVVLFVLLENSVIEIYHSRLVLTCCLQILLMQ